MHRVRFLTILICMCELDELDECWKLLSAGYCWVLESAESCVALSYMMLSAV